MLAFLKLGGSLITNKGRVNTARHALITQLGKEIASALGRETEISLVLGHGSGSFGHYAALKHTHNVNDRVEVSRAGIPEIALAARTLNQIVLERMYAANVPVTPLQLTASMMCEGGRVIHIQTEPIAAALAQGLVPVIYGDIAFDRTLGATIASTEIIFAHLAPLLAPDRILLAGQVEGVLDSSGDTIPLITPESFQSVTKHIGASEWSDVTGGMSSKVSLMLNLCRKLTTLSVHIFSGRHKGSVAKSLSGDTFRLGTTLSS